MNNTDGAWYAQVVDSEPAAFKFTVTLAFTFGKKVCVVTASVPDSESRKHHWQWRWLSRNTGNHHDTTLTQSSGHAGNILLLVLDVIMMTDSVG
jgi:hypothetical protein